MRALDGRVAVVTGAASGIGRALALALGVRGADLVICDVDEPGLADTAASLGGLGRDVLARRVDVSDGDAMRAFAEEVAARCGAPDLLVNNAGVGLGAGFLETRLEDWDWILGINLRGVIHGCHFFLPPMVERGRGGHVVNVASMAAFGPSEILAAYGTTKAAVLALSESLALELRPHRIGVTAVCPGIIDTPITRNTRLRGRAERPGTRDAMIETYRRRGYGPERVARAVLRAIQRGRTVAPVSPEAWALYYARRLAPGAVRGLSAWLERRGRARLEGGG
jgi:NAD(P)-dependent dehydrogenase (short-subunit alcohol dehydrogenase family)